MSEGQSHPEIRFDDIARLTDREIQRLMRIVDTRDLAGALKGATPEMQDRIFSNVSERVRSMIRPEMEALDSDPASAEELRVRMAQMAQQLIQKGEIGHPGEPLTENQRKRKRERQDRHVQECREKLDRLNREKGPGIDLSTVAGLVLGILVVAFGIRQGASLFRPGPAAGFVLLGAMAVVLTSHRLSDLPGLVKLAGKALFHRSIPLRAWIEYSIVFCELARREGILSVSQTLDLAPDPFLRVGVECAVDGIEPRVAKKFLEVELKGLEKRHRAGHALMATACIGGGLFGVIGLLLGLIVISSNATGATSGGIGAAFIPLLWGGIVCGLCYALRGKLQKMTALEVLQRRMVIMSIFEIQHGTHPVMLRWALTRLVAPRLRTE